jgi:hypothetical protein
VLLRFVSGTLEIRCPGPLAPVTTN